MLVIHEPKYQEYQVVVHMSDRQELLVAMMAREKMLQREAPDSFQGKNASRQELAAEGEFTRTVGSRISNFRKGGRTSVCELEECQDGWSEREASC